MVANQQNFNLFQNAISDLIEKVSFITSNPDQIILSNKQLQELMGISRKTAQKWRDNGLINYYKIGREIFYRKSDILKMLDNHLVPSFSS